RGGRRGGRRAAVVPRAAVGARGGDPARLRAHGAGRPRSRGPPRPHRLRRPRLSVDRSHGLIRGVAVAEAWRVVKEEYARSAFDGEGARRAGGRFNGGGTAVVYAADSLALALLEVAVHVPTYRALRGRVAFRLTFDEALVETLAEAGLPADWRSTPPS